MNSKPGRFWEIDFFRGLAVLLMMLFHFLYDLDYFRLLTLSMNSGPLLYLGRSSAVLFILLSGTALSISYSKKKNGNPDPFKAPESEFPKYLKRGLKLFSLGLLLSAVTRIFLKDQYIVFGILHFFGTASILVYPLLPLKKGNLLSGLLCILAGLFLREKTFGFSTLLWLGFLPEHFRSLDYFPIFPWFGVLLLGLYLGKTLYPEGRRNFAFKDLSKNLPVKGLCRIGKHSLFIYLIHQPVFLALLYIAGFLDLDLI